MASVHKTETVPVRNEADIVAVRQLTRMWSADCKFSLVDQTKMVTAASELARNALIYGGGGVVRFELVEENARRGVRLSFIDQGPGIADVEQALKDGFTSGAGLGLGLGGSRRLVNEFEIRSEAGKGTTVVVTRWK